MLHVSTKLSAWVRTAGEKRVGLFCTPAGQFGAAFAPSRQAKRHESEVNRVCPRPAVGETAFISALFCGRMAARRPSGGAPRAELGRRACRLGEGRDITHGKTQSATRT
jgi:hypothetical protein